MKRRLSVSRRLLALALVLGVALGAVPRPAAAADTPSSAPPLAASIARAAHTIPLAPTAGKAKASRDDQQRGGDELAGSTAFFARPIGIAVLAVLAAGTGYAIYSTSHDRIHSPQR